MKWWIALFFVGLVLGDESKKVDEEKKKPAEEGKAEESRTNEAVIAPEARRDDAREGRVLESPDSEPFHPAGVVKEHRALVTDQPFRPSVPVQDLQYDYIQERGAGNYNNYGGHPSYGQSFKPRAQPVRYESSRYQRPYEVRGAYGANSGISPSREQPSWQVYRGLREELPQVHVIRSFFVPQFQRFHEEVQPSGLVPSAIPYQQVQNTLPYPLRVLYSAPPDESNMVYQGPGLNYGY